MSKQTDDEPKGRVLPWDNKQIPEGWVVCDGKNGTPKIGPLYKGSIWIMKNV